MKNIKVTKINMFRPSRPLGFQSADIHNQEHDREVLQTTRAILSRSASLSRALQQNYDRHTQEYNYCRQEERDIFNNAYLARLQNPISDKVETSEVPVCGYRQIMCNRSIDSAQGIRPESCDILGPDLCSDCIKLRQRVRSAHKQRCQFPDVDIHPRSMTAPNKMDFIISSFQNNQFKKQNRGKGSPNLSSLYHSRGTYFLNTDGVYTENDLIRRLRSQRLEHKNVPIRKAERPRSAIVQFVELKAIQKPEITKISPPMMKINTT